MAHGQTSIAGGRERSTFAFEPCRGCRKLTLGQSINAVVLDDVDHRDIAAQQVDELPPCRWTVIAVTTDADRRKRLIGKHGSVAIAGNASMDAI